MRILYEGNDVHAFPHCTEAHLSESLRALGHDVVYAVVQKRTATELAGLLDGTEPDLFLLTRPWGTESGATSSFLETCARRGIPTAGFHLDRFWGLPEREQWIRDRTDPLFCVDVLFSTDDGPEWAAHGINHHWMPPAVYASEAYDAVAEREWIGAYDVAFVGSYGYHAEWPHRAELIDTLRSWYGRRFVHVGNGGDLPPMRGDQLNRFYRSVPVVVGDSCLVRHDRPYWSDRVPETWGRGGFLVHPQVDELERQLGPGLPGYGWMPGDWEYLAGIIDFYLRDRDAREHRRLSTAKRVRADHTYRDRARELVDVVERLAW